MTSKRHATRIHKQQNNNYVARAQEIVTRLSRAQIAGIAIGMALLVFGLNNTRANNPQQYTEQQSQQYTDTQNSVLPNIESTRERKTFNIDLSQPTMQVERSAAIATNPTITVTKTAINTSANKSTLSSSATRHKNVTDKETTTTHSEVVGPPSPFRNISHRIKSGENLSAIFANVGLSQQDVYNITNSGKQGKALTRMFPGEMLTFSFRDNHLHHITRQKNPLESVHFTPSDGSYLSEIKTRTPLIKQLNKSGIVSHSLSRAAEKAGLSQSTIMNMANIFGGVMDFALDVRGGDRFTIVYEEHYLDGKKIKDGNIIAAQYTNRGTEHNAFRYQHDSGRIGYYNKEGVSLRRVFLRAPLDFTRVSSSFNLRRLHPITKRVKPHRGIDYAAARGTPVHSVGEGRVITSGYSSANGKYVVIKHGEAYTTKYLHLHKRAVKKGQRVKQGQTIGQVGCTGLCTGPHLHYEFLWNGVHRNPRTIVKKLPKAKRLASSQLPAFSVATASAQNILQHYSAQFEIAANDQ